MTTLHSTTDTLVEWTRADCSPFLNWDEEKLDSVHKRVVVFRSLVATMKLQPEFDVSLEAKAVKCLKYVEPLGKQSTDAFLNSFVRTSDDFSTNFIQPMMVLLSSPSLVIATAAMQMLASLIASCSTKIHLLLVKADLIPQIIVTSTLQSLSFEKVKYIHTYFISIIVHSFWLATPDYLAKPTFKDEDEQQAVHETVLKQVLSPLEKYISHLCVNRYSIVDRDLSAELLKFIAHILQISLVYQPAMDFVLNLPREWANRRGEERQMVKTVQRMLRMEGIEDVLEEKLRSDQDGLSGECPPESRKGAHWPVQNSNSPRFREETGISIRRGTLRSELKPGIKLIIRTPTRKRVIRFDPIPSLSSPISDLSLHTNIQPSLTTLAYASLTQPGGPMLRLAAALNFLDWFLAIILCIFPTLIVVPFLIWLSFLTYRGIRKMFCCCPRQPTDFTAQMARAEDLIAEAEAEAEPEEPADQPAEIDETPEQRRQRLEARREARRAVQRAAAAEQESESPQDISQTTPLLQSARREPLSVGGDGLWGGSEEDDEAAMIALQLAMIDAVYRSQGEQTRERHAEGNRRERNNGTATGQNSVVEAGYAADSQPAPPSTQTGATSYPTAFTPLSAGFGVFQSLHFSLLLRLIHSFDLKILMSVNANEARQRVCEHSESDEEEHQREVHKDASGTIELGLVEDFKMVRSGERNLPSVEQHSTLPTSSTQIGANWRKLCVAFERSGVEERLKCERKKGIEDVLEEKLPVQVQQPTGHGPSPTLPLQVAAVVQSSSIQTQLQPPSSHLKIGQLAEMEGE
ncbi:hypothetical protein BLNAU_23074 [Blattamonas nauphoetae]|uniref:Uncharacterized protein n=1 Tax=Blattamonas nauphoetae TaxID=2049346 RepID=A0ABQ9WSF3_9EUKA|nr:hypothetical protein BLNAU_23074 [Blattamonas nauphoetae]